MLLPNRIENLIKRITTLQRLLARYVDHDPLTAHLNIDRYYYIQKTVELELLLEALKAQRLDEETITKRYLEVDCQWRKDVQVLHTFINKLPRSGSAHDTD